MSLTNYYDNHPPKQSDIYPESSVGGWDGPTLQLIKNKKVLEDMRLNARAALIHRKKTTGESVADLAIMLGLLDE